MLRRLLDVVVEHERPILEAHELSMWEYVIVSRLAAQDGVTQRELASSSRRDPTRLGANLDALTARGLVDREVDTADRRRHLVRLTPAGRDLLARVRRDVGAMEEELTGGTSSRLRSTLSTALRRLDADGDADGDASSGRR